MFAQEHAPMIGGRRGQGGWLCHRSSRGCTCQGSSAEKKFERRTMKKVERQAVRLELKGFVK